MNNLLASDRSDQGAPVSYLKRISRPGNVRSGYYNFPRRYLCRDKFSYFIVYCKYRQNNIQNNQFFSHAKILWYDKAIKSIFSQLSHSIRFLKSSLHWANRFWRNNRVCEEIKKRCIVVKKAKRFLALFLVLCMMVCAMALPASAYSYNFSFPAQQANSMRSTSLYTRGTSTAYVDPDVTTISTIYFLSPTRVSSTQATALVYKTSGTRSNFSWLSGYGGKGNSYCLSGCPDWNVGSHTAYSSYGSWNM